MELFNKLKNLVVEDDTPQVQAPQIAVAAQVIAQVAQVQVTADTPSVLDTAVVEAGIEAQIQANPAHAMFITFNKSVQSLEKVIPDEATRFKAAQATTSLITADLVAAVESAKQVIANETANFEATFVAQSQAAITAVENEKTSVEAQIQTLTEQLGQLSDHKNNLAKDSVSKTAELAKAKIDFTSVVGLVDKRYSEISRKLTQFLGA